MSIIAGDFNAHHKLWESNTTANRAGISISNFLLDYDSLVLNTPKTTPLVLTYPPARHLPLTIVFLSTCRFKLGSYWGSDIPIHFFICAKPCSIIHPPIDIKKKTNGQPG